MHYHKKQAREANKTATTAPNTVERVDPDETGVVAEVALASFTGVDGAPIRSSPVVESIEDPVEHVGKSVISKQLRDVCIPSVDDAPMAYMRYMTSGLVSNSCPNERTTLEAGTVAERLITVC